MGETNKQVRVDNWGIFFLQRLQMFFNKTDYCDLTLQFEGNVQLKVHRLVMSACTEYFNVLEHTCEVIDGNTIIMPDDLQTDVILPIVNFMYTGMLDFNMSIYDKLYRTAELMNIPILTKLLDAQRKPVQRTINRNLAQKTVPRKVHNDLPSPLPGRKVPVWKRKTLPVTPQRTLSPHMPETIIRKTIPSDPLALFDNTPKPTRFEWPDDELDSTFNLIDSSFNDISYTSKPLLTQDDELRASTSFEDLKQSQSVNKKSNNYTNQPVDINDIKDYVKEQKTRAELAECDEEFDCDDPENYLSVKRKPKEEISPETSAKRVRFNEKENRETTISVTPKNPGEMDHTKIISEVLKKYPHLVKRNKNIKLKIMSKPPAKNELKTVMKSAITKLRLAQKEAPKVKIVKSQKIQQDDEGPWLCRKCPTANDEPVEFVLYYLYRKHMTEVHNEKFDPNMCKHCGHQSPKQSVLIYHQYTKHGVLPPPAFKFPKCDRCPFIAMTETMLQKHSLNHSKFELQCTECKVAFNTEHSLAAHMQITGHTGKSVGMTNFDCQYCTKRYNTSSDLFSHIKSLHRDEARRDGMVSIDETEYEEEDNQDDEEFLPANIPEHRQPHEEKVNVISNVKVPTTTVQSTSSEIIGNIGISGTGLVDIVVLDDNQQYILHNDQRLINNQGGYMQIDNSHNLSRNITEVITSQPNVMLQNTEIASTDELVMVLTDHDYNDGNNGILTNDNSNIVVLYSHPVDGQQNQFITSEGKLMLNSQTGMLELRNENTDSQDGQIESIELIQREIDSGLLQQGGGVETEGGAGQEMTSAVEGSVQDPGVDYHEEVTGGDKVAEVVDQEAVDNGKMVAEEESEGGDQGTEGEMMEVEEEQNIEAPVINTEQKPNALPDLSEDTTEELQIIMNEDAVDHPVSESMPIEQYHPASGEIQEYPPAESVETEHHDTETIEHMETENSEVPAEEVAEETQIEESVENSQNPDENICGEYLGQQENQADSGEAAVPEIVSESTDDKITDEYPKNSDCENFQVEDASHEVIEEETSAIVQKEGEEMHVSVPDTVSEGNVLEEEFEPSQSENIPVSEEVFSEQPSEIETDIVQENEETIPENEETIPENEETVPENEEMIPENEELMQENEEALLENQELNPENHQLIPENPESVLENEESVPENHELIHENEESMQENEEALPENEETTQENDVEELVFLGTPTADEENVSEEAHPMVEESTSEDVQIDENSQTQDSQTSSSKEQSSDVEKPETSRSTKISILDDWEDTEDSQQSDNTIKKAEITVNTLIDDWDDEDEESTKKSAEV